jgi:hypothetical protein
MAITAVRWRDRPAVLWAALLSCAVVVLSLGPHLHVFGRILDRPPLPWSLVSELPVLTQALPSRLMVDVYLLAGFLLAHFLHGAVVNARGLVVRVPAAGLVVLSLLLLAPMATPWVTRRPAPAFFAGPAARRIPEGSVALVAPWARPADAAAMVWQAESGYRYRMPEGYAIRPGPGGEAAFAPPPSATGDALSAIELGRGPPARGDALRRSMACDLAGWRVRTVVVGPMRHQDQAVATMAWVIGRAPEPVDGVWVWWDVAPGCPGG